MKKTLIVVLMAALLVPALSSCRVGGGEVIIMAGSTSVKPFAEVLAEEYARMYPGRPIIEVQGGGSTTGIKAVQSGSAEIGMSSRHLKGAEVELWSYEIAKDGLAVIVHPSNPVSSLTLEQIRGIYAMEITNWAELGGNNAKIHIISREEGSGTRSAFEELVMGETYISPKSIVQGSNGAVRLLVSGNKNAIGYISLGLVEDKDQDPVKALALSGVSASREHITDGSYKLFRPFLFVTDGEPDGDVMMFIEFVKSPAGTAILERGGLIVG